jgi:hypothetical protein
MISQPGNFPPLIALSSQIGFVPSNTAKLSETAANRGLQPQELALFRQTPSSPFHSGPNSW